VQGVIDYSKSDPHNPMWWKRWRYLIQAMEDETHEKLLRETFRYQLALVSNSRISPDDFTAVQREAKELFNDLEGNMRPWIGRTKENRQADQYTMFKEQWKQLAGFDPSDKEAVAKWGAELEKVTKASGATLAKAEKEEQERKAFFYAKVEEIRRKRLKQQGRN
jgi:hypothetical protein